MKMKPLKIVFATMFIFALAISCNKRSVESFIAPDPSETGIIPIEYVGNQDCEDLIGEYPGGTTGRINYDQLTDQFDGDWSDYGLTVIVTDDKYVAFEMDAGSQWCVGAVIVKGGNASNVYYYTPGVKSDEALVSPINASGKPADLSNLTFCFVECENLVIAVKALYSDGTRNLYCESEGTQAFFTTAWCANLGINIYPTTALFNMIWPGIGTKIGEVKVENGDVTVTLNEGKTLITTYLFVGTLEELQTNNLKDDGCPWYTNPSVWIQNTTPGTDANGLSFMFFDL